MPASYVMDVRHPDQSAVDQHLCHDKGYRPPGLARRYRPSVTTSAGSPKRIDPTQAKTTPSGAGWVERTLSRLQEMPRDPLPPMT